MKKQIAISALCAGLMCSTNLVAADDLSTMFSEGKVSGQIRTFYINRDDTTKSGNQIATSIGGHLKLETADYSGLSFGTAFYTTNRILRDLEDDAMGPNTTLLKNDGSSYSVLGEAYLQYKRGNTAFKAGRQKLNTPLAGADDARMIPNLFEAYVLSNSDITNTTLVAAHVTNMAPGTFANAYNGGIVGATAGYTAIAGNTAKYQGDFTNMGKWAVGKDTAGVTALAAVYADGGLKAQLWDYYAYDILNAVYAQVDYSMKTDSISPFVAAQFIKEDSIGDEYAGNVESMFWGAKVGASFAGLKAYVAYSQQSDAEAGKSLESATITPWGGMPAFTQGMVTRHMFLPGTKATKVAATYSFKEMGTDLSATAYYATFDLDANSGLGDIETKEPGFDIKYNPQAVKNLNLRLRGNFPTEFANNRDWNEFRFIANYNF